MLRRRQHRNGLIDQTMGTAFNFLLVVQALVAAGLVGLVLMQRSEGGGLGIGGGGSPGGVMSARGAADVLSRATKWFAIMFVVLAIVLAGLAQSATGGGELESTLDRSTAASDAEGPAGAESVPAPAAGTTDGTPVEDDPLAGVAE